MILIDAASREPRSLRGFQEFAAPATEVEYFTRRTGKARDVALLLPANPVFATAS